MNLRNWVLKQFGGVPAEESRGGSFEVVMEAINSNRAAEASAPITNESALRMSAVYGCIRILAETVGSLPLITYERLDRGRRKAPNFYLYSLLHDQPNETMAADEYRAVVQNHLASWGNAYSQILYDRRGRIEQLLPLLPWGIVGDTIRDGQRYYKYENQSTGETNWYGQDEIWHLRGLGSDGKWGYNPIALMRKAIRLGLSAEEFGWRFFENDARPGIYLEHPGVLKDEAYKHLKESWEEEHQGASKSHKPAILEEGMKLHEVGIPPEDAQFLETRKFQVTEIARIFRIPPHMLADLDRATFSNIEHQSLEFVMHSIRPWLVHWEKSISLNLMLPAERERYYAEHLVEGLLRGDIKSRYEAYAVGRQNGWLSANDIRELENMNPVDGGDVYLVPLNMIPADQVGSLPDPASAARTLPGEANRHIETIARRLASRQGAIFGDALGRILRRERNDVGAQARKLLGADRRDELEPFFGQFYEAHAAWSAGQILPVIQTSIQLLAEMVGVTVSEADLGRFSSNFARDFGQREAQSSLQELLELVRGLKNATPEELAAAVEARLETWLDPLLGRAAQTATDEALSQNLAASGLLFGNLLTGGPNGSTN